MEFLNSPDQLVLTIAVLVAGFLMGVGCMLLLDRRKAGGKSVDELRGEFEDYREKVADHFTTTSDLFRDMTEKYRDVYNHLAEGSQALCEDPMQHGRLEFSEHKEIQNDEPVAAQNDAAAEADEAPVLEKTV